MEEKRKKLDDEGVAAHVQEDKKYYDDIHTEVVINDKESFATFARGKAIGLLNKESLADIIKYAAKKREQPLDPFTRQPLDATILAWFYQIPSKTPFTLVAMIPSDHTITKLVTHSNYLTLVDTKGTFSIYNTALNEVVTLNTDGKHDSIFVAEDGQHAVTYKYLSTGIYTISSITETTSYYWTITPDKVTKKDLRSPAVKGAFITANDDAYLFYTGEGFTRWSNTRLQKGTLRLTKKVVTIDELYRPQNTYLMQIHYTNNKLIYYNSTKSFISYVERKDDNTFSVLCENKAYSGATDDISPIAFSPDGNLMVIYFRSRVKIEIYNIAEEKPTLVTSFTPPIRGYNKTELAFSTDKKYLFIAYSNLILVYNISTTPPTLVQQIQVGKTKELTPSSPGIPPIHLAYFNGFVVAAIEDLVYFFKEKE